MSTQAKQEAFIQGIENGTFQGDAATIYKLIEQNHVMTLPEISVILDKSLNQFSGRISELLDAGLIKEMKGEKYSLFRITKASKKSTIVKRCDRMKRLKSCVKKRMN
jgi:predicted HTH transcriptional regulator